MYSIKKSFNFYTFTIIQGNLYFWILVTLSDSPISFLQFNTDQVLFFFGATYICSFPVGIASLIFFSIQKTEWTTFTSSVSSATTMALIISIGWAIVLSYTIFNHTDEYLTTMPFIIADPIAAILGELWHDHKQTKPESNRNQQSTVSKLHDLA